MKFAHLLITTFIFYTIFGFAMMFAAPPSAAFMGLSFDLDGIFASQLLGAALLAFAGTNWTSRKFVGVTPLQPVIFGNFIFAFITAILIIASIFSGTLNANSWILALIQLLFAAGFGYYLFIKKNYC